MSLSDDDRPRPAAGPRPGDDLSLLSIAEIEERIEMFRAEIRRLEQALSAKRASLAAARSVFRT